MTETHVHAHRFRVQLPDGEGYEVDTRAGLLASYGALCRDLVPRAGSRVVVLTDDRVQRLYGAQLSHGLAAAGVDFAVLQIDAGERSKSLASFERLIDGLARLGMDRRGLLVNFGGGVVTDLGGFVAAGYMRGIAYANLPTTLIGQVDAAIGGKVAVNSPHAKNLIGAFHHPVHVASDPELLRTLSKRDFRSGMAEAIKVAIIASPELFDYIESHRDRLVAGDTEALTRVIAHAAGLKQELLAGDPYERDLRRPLNFGHSLGHPIETEFAYRDVRHGEAVAVGMAVATFIARRKGLVDATDAERILAVLTAYGLMGCAPPIHAMAVIGHLRYVRLIRGYHLHFVLPVRIGGVIVTDELGNDDILRGFSDYDDCCLVRGLREAEA